MISPEELEKLKKDLPNARVIKRADCKDLLIATLAAQKDVIAVTASFGDFIFED